MLLLLALQAAAPPDIQLQAVVEARSMTIEKKGEARLEVWAEPDAGSIVKAEAPRGAKSGTLRNVRVTLDAEARIGSPVADAPSVAETEPEEPR